MAEEKATLEQWLADIAIKKCAAGFLVRGDQYGGVGLRAFSGPEGLIEWLSRELGAGPIVWALTLDIWGEGAKVLPEDLVPVPDPLTNPSGYQAAVEDNAYFLLSRFVEAELEKRKPPTPPKPEKKRAGKEPKEEPKEEGKKE